ncbi:MAG: hypothetical protein WD072_06440 [Pirellulales bacterium]
MSVFHKRLVWLALSLCPCASAAAQVARYNPYADAEQAPAPLAADGTIQWGAFYKSAAIQQNYERLWSIGACRGTSKAIVEPVQRNKLIIDRLPEAEYEGVVVAAAGTLAGGMVAFRENPAAQAPLVAQLHPAGVTRLRVSGRTPGAILRPGFVIRLVAEVDERGRALEPVTAFEVVTPLADYKPDPVRAGSREQIVGVVRSIASDVLTLHVNAGRLRRLTFNLAPDAVATLDAARLDLASPGDAIAVTGRIWSGEGAMAAGTIFASEVTITKPPLAGEVAVPAAPRVAGRP